MSEPRVQVRQRAADHQGQWGRATYIGKASDGEDVYRVVFGEPGFEHSAKFRASDLTFEAAPSLREYLNNR